MRHCSIGRGALVFLLLLATACGGSPTAPTLRRPPPSPASTPPPIPPATNFPPPVGPSRTFTFDHALTPRVSDYTTRSRFVLYDNGAFALQFESPIGEYRGGYTQSNGVITFEWEGWSVAGPWGATGTLKDGTLTIRYNEVMIATDFEDAVYLLTP